MAVPPRRERRSERSDVPRERGLRRRSRSRRLWQGADDEADVLPYARDQGSIVVTSDVSDFGSLSEEAAPAVVLLYDDTAEAYRVAGGLLAMIEAYPAPDELPQFEVLDDWM